MKSVYDVIIRPVITEQSMEDLDIKKFAFEVAKDATKIEVKKAVEEIFGVTVVKEAHRPLPRRLCEDLEESRCQAERRFQEH